jgi:hypothetical protein
LVRKRSEVGRGRGKTVENEIRLAKVLLLFQHCHRAGVRGLASSHWRESAPMEAAIWIEEVIGGGEGGDGNVAIGCGSV